MDLTHSYKTAIPDDVLARYECFEVRNAAGILKATNPEQFENLVEVLRWFRLYTDDLITPGGQETNLAARLNHAFRSRGWREARVDTKIILALALRAFDGEPKPETIETVVENEGYQVDNFLYRVALDVEWNAKDGNLDRDLAAYRFLYQSGLIDGAVIITRTHKGLRDFGRELAAKAGQTEKEIRRVLGTSTTTNTEKLEPRVKRGDSGGCPLLVIAVSEKTWAGEGVQPSTEEKVIELESEATDEQAVPGLALTPLESLGADTPPTG